jgi:hypothetical protein
VRSEQARGVPATRSPAARIPHSASAILRDCIPRAPLSLVQRQWLSSLKSNRKAVESTSFVVLLFRFRVGLPNNYF